MLKGRPAGYKAPAKSAAPKMKAGKGIGAAPKKSPAGSKPMKQPKSPGMKKPAGIKPSAGAKKMPGAAKKPKNPVGAKPPKSSPKPKMSGAAKTLKTTQKKGMKQAIKTHTQKMVFHQRQSERLKTAGAHEASHPQHAKYQSHMASIQKHKTGAVTTSRKLSQHVSNRPGGKAGAGGRVNIKRSSVSKMMY